MDQQSAIDALDVVKMGHTPASKRQGSVWSKQVSEGATLAGNMARSEREGGLQQCLSLHCGAGFTHFPRQAYAYTVASQRQYSGRQQEKEAGGSQVRLCSNRRAHFSGRGRFL